jgi:hypothetical protein
MAQTGHKSLPIVRRYIRGAVAHCGRPGSTSPLASDRWLPPEAGCSLLPFRQIHWIRLGACLPIDCADSLNDYAEIRWIQAGKSFS